MIFINKSYSELRIFIDITSVEKDKDFCHLGIFFYGKLKFTDHIFSLNNKVTFLSEITNKWGENFDHTLQKYFATHLYIWSWVIALWSGVVSFYIMTMTKHITQSWISWKIYFKDIFFYLSRYIEKVYKQLKR